MRKVTAKERAEAKKRFVGKDNYGNEKIEYFDKVAAMSDAEVLKETELKIWLSAFANNNPRSDYHWHVDVLYIECEKRSKTMYQRAFNKASGRGE